MKKIYFAGKIKKNDWRHGLVPWLGDSCLYENYGKNYHPTIDGFEYVGPFFRSCDHGCYHGKNTHGVVSNDSVCAPELSRDQVFNQCISNLYYADIIFTYIEDVSCYGTLFELGYAYGAGLLLDKDIYIFINNKIKQQSYELWFALQSTNEVHYVNDEYEAWDKFLKCDDIIAYTIINKLSKEV